MRFQTQLDVHSELKALELEHAAELAALIDCNRSRLREWLPWLDRNKSQADSEAFIRFCLESEAARKTFTAGIWHEGRLAGVASYHPVDWNNRKVSIGYWVGEEFGKNGLATQAARALTRQAFEALDLNRVEIHCATGNVPSQRVAEAIGMTREGTLREAECLYGRFVDHHVYAALKAEWRP
jgi:ribosomal-protein-serine acetyltransferase